MLQTKHRLCRPLFWGVHQALDIYPNVAPRRTGAYPIRPIVVQNCKGQIRYEHYCGGRPTLLDSGLVFA